MIEDRAPADTRGWPTALAASALVLAVYLPALTAGFFSDDYQWLGRMASTVVRPSYVFTVFFRDFNPLLHLSYLGDWLFGGGSPLAFHLTSILIHSISTLLLCLLLYRLTGNRWITLAAVLT